MFKPPCTVYVELSKKSLVLSWLRKGGLGFVLTECCSSASLLEGQFQTVEINFCKYFVVALVN